jgi:hypothetical protein
MNRRQQWTHVLTFALGIVFVLMVLARSHTLGKADLVLVGQMSNFPESENPYPVCDPGGFLVHLNTQFIFLSSRFPHEVFQQPVS